MIDGYHYTIRDLEGPPFPPPWLDFDEPTLKRIWDSFFGQEHDPWRPKSLRVPGWEYAVYLPAPQGKLLRCAHFELHPKAMGYDLMLIVTWHQDRAIGIGGRESEAVIWRDLHRGDRCSECPDLSRGVVHIANMACGAMDKVD